MQARFYLPMYGRFASPDPKRDVHFEDTQGWNIYSYCQNNPAMRIDPDGMEDGFPSAGPSGGDLAYAASAIWSGIKAGAKVVANAWVSSAHELQNDPEFMAAARNINEMTLIVPIPVQVPTPASPGLAPVTPEGVVVPLAPVVPATTPLAIPSPAVAAMSGGRGDQYGHKSGKNEKHSNPDARNAAKEKLDAKQAELTKAKKANDLSKEGRQNLRDLEREIKHLRRKMEDTGETHGRGGK